MHAAVTVWYASARVYAPDACLAVGSVHVFVLCVHTQYDKLLCHHTAIALLLHRA
jgi:hypothetical protein